MISLKALILAGNRYRQNDKKFIDTNRCLVSISGKPVLEQNLDRAIEVPSVDDIIIVLGYGGEDIINSYGNIYKGHIIKYVIQWTQRGIVHAIYNASREIGDDDFFLLIADEIIKESNHEMMADYFHYNSFFGVCGVVRPRQNLDISNTYGVSLEGFSITEVEENPIETIKYILQGTGHCMFSNNILSYIRKTPINESRGERDLAGLIQCAIDNGEDIKAFEIGKSYNTVTGLLKKVEKKKEKEINS